MKRLLAAVLTLSMCLGLAACGGGKRAAQTPDPMPTELTLKEPVYPKFPQYPVPSSQVMEEEEYYKAQTAYQKEVEQFRGGELEQGLKDTLIDFTARSAPVALEQKAGQNGIYSSASLWLALGVLARCTDGESRTQILDALGVDRVEDLQRNVGLVWKNLYNDDGRSILRLANSIWLNSAMKGTCVQSTLDDLAQHYFAGSYRAKMGTPEADEAMADWVEKQTGGLIRPQLQTGPEELAVLMSTLYYKAGWVDAFDPDLTDKDVFTGPGGDTQADFMHATDRDNYLMGEGWRAARRQNHLGAMIFVLPDEGVSPEELLAQPDFLKGLDLDGPGSRYGRIDWSMPKFDVECKLDLNNSLKQMGVTAVLDQKRADFSALSDLPAYLEQVNQLTRVKAEERGVEAAAVTIMMLPTCAIEEEPEICEMDLNRPFLFVLQVSGVPLFVGVVNDVS